MRTQTEDVWRCVPRCYVYVSHSQHIFSSHTFHLSIGHLLQVVHKNIKNKHVREYTIGKIQNVTNEQTALIATLPLQNTIFVFAHLYRRKFTNTWLHTAFSVESHKLEQWMSKMCTYSHWQCISNVHCISIACINCCKKSMSKSNVQTFHFFPHGHSSKIAKSNLNIE